jgi:WD40 repeat protein
MFHPTTTQTTWAASLVALATFLMASGPLLAADSDEKASQDLYGDPLPPGALARLGTVRFRHAASSAAYSPDGKLLAIGGADNEIWLFDAATGKEVRHWTAHQARTYNPPRDPKSAFDALVNSTGKGNVTCLAFAPDGKMLASGGWDDTVRLWDPTTGKEVRKIDAHKAMVAAVVFSADGKTLASRGGLDGMVRLWDPTTGKERHTIEGLSKVNPWRFNRSVALAISPDSATLAVGDLKVIHLYDLASGKETNKLEGHRSCLCVTFSADGKLLASGGVDAGKDQNSIRIWDVKAAKEVRQCALPKNEPPIDLAFNPDGSRLAAVIEEVDAHIFDVKTGKPVHRLNHYWPSRVAYSPNGKTLITVRGPTVRTWSALTGNELHLEFKGHQAGVTAIAYSPDAKMIATGGDHINLWDAASSKLLRRITVKGTVAALAFAPDSKAVVSAGRDRVARLWDVATGKQLQEFKGHKHSLCGVALSPDGKTLATGDVQATSRLWDVESGKELHQMDMKSLTENLSLAFSPDSKTLACAGAWNDSSFLPKGGINIQGVEVTPKEGYLVLTWDVATGKEVHRFAGLTDAIKSAAWSPDGKRLAAASRDGRVAIWDASTGKELLHILAHPDHVDAAFSSSPGLAFSPNGKTLASASTDKTVRLWDVSTAKELGRFLGADGGFYTVAFSPGGKKMVAGSSDTTAIIWDVTAAGKLPKPKKPNVILIGD